MRRTAVLICSLEVLLLGILIQFSHIFWPLSQNDAFKKGYDGPPVATGHAYFTESFPSKDSFKARWIVSKSKKDGSQEMQYNGEWKVEEPWSNPLPADLGLVLKTKTKHHAVSVMLDEPFIFSDKTFVIQYEVRFQSGQSCGGGYVKLLSQTRDLDLTYFNDRTQYTIMFGPDTCAGEPKIHFIMQHKNPLTKLYEEKRLKESARKIDSSYFYDKKTHLYTLVIDPSNSFEIYIDRDLHVMGNLLKDMSPPINPPKEFLDWEDRKPEDWDDRKQIPDPDSVKPDDWDESEPNMIVDHNDVKPLEWLDDEPILIPDPKAVKPTMCASRLAEWEPPKIRNPKCVVGCGKWTPAMYTNPKYKGPWNPPMISNPNYKGEWRPRMLPNAKYFEDLHPFKMTAIAAIGLELWSVSKNILFDNFIITDDKSVADKWAEDSWNFKHEIEMGQPVQQDPGLYRTVVDGFEDQPYLWSVVAVLVIVPGIVVIVFCVLQAKGYFERFDEPWTKVEEPIPDIKRDERGADESVVNQDAAAADASGDNGRDARQGENDDGCKIEVNRPTADCKEFMDVDSREQFLQKPEEASSCEAEGNGEK